MALLLLVVEDVRCNSVGLRSSTHCIIKYLISTARLSARCRISGQNASPQSGSSRTAVSIAFNQKLKSSRWVLLDVKSAKSEDDKKSHKRHATVTRRIVGSEERTCETIQAGQPSARQKSRSSVRMQCNQVKAPRASPLKARSGSVPCRLPRTRVAICVA